MISIIETRKRLSAGIVFVIILLTFSNSCTKQTDKPGLNQVFIKNMAFDPGTITVGVNTTITWFNKDGVAHTVTSTTGSFDSHSISPNGTFVQLFSTAGTFNYKCTLHPTMTGTVIVN